MLIPLQVTFRRTPRVDWLEAEIQRRAAGLERYCPSIAGCRVIVEPAHRHHREGNPYHVRIDLTVPGEEIVVSHEAGMHATAKDIGVAMPTKVMGVRAERRYANVAIRHAFEAARRQLQDYRRRQARVVKVHEPQPRGRIVRLLPKKNCGFLTAPDGHEVYFHRHSVLDDGFDRLDIGEDVTFVEEKGERGPQASTVRPILRRGAPRCGIRPMPGRPPEHRPARRRPSSRA